MINSVYRNILKLNYYISIKINNKNLYMTIFVIIKYEYEIYDNLELEIYINR